MRIAAGLPTQSTDQVGKPGTPAKSTLNINRLKSTVIISLNIRSLLIQNVSAVDKQAKTIG